MRLMRLWVDGFKNLNKFEIDFESREGITVLIGNNGSGKSNVLEAISAIFSGLYTNTLEDLPFKFDLSYQLTTNHLLAQEIDGEQQSITVRISKKQKIRHRIIRENQTSYTELDKNRIYKNIDDYSNNTYPYYFPSQIIALYSGEELRLWNNYYSNFYLKYNADVIANRTNIETSQKMLYINKYYWDIALLTMIASGIDMNAIIDDIQIQSISIEVNTSNLAKFKEQGFNEVVSFVDHFYFNEAGERIDEKSTVSFSGDNLADRLDSETHRRLFNLLCVAKLPKDPKDTLIKNLELTFNNGLTTQDFSEGQKKQILLKLTLDVLADENSLILFDEPDSHIHIANKQRLPDLIKDAGDREVVLTTHSPTLMNKFDKKHLFYLEQGKETNLEKVDILKQLSANTMSFAQQQILLYSSEDILIVEGKTDEKYITTALEKLSENNDNYKDLKFNFLILGGSDPEILNGLISKFQPKDGQTIIAFFDRDKAGFDCIKKVLDYKGNKEEFNGSIKSKTHIYFYPKKPEFTTSNFEIEDYFPIEKCRNFVFEDIKSFENLKSKFNKNNFAEECKNFEPSDFEGFKNLFKLILEIKNQ